MDLNNPGDLFAPLSEPLRDADAFMDSGRGHLEILWQDARREIFNAGAYDSDQTWHFRYADHMGDRQHQIDVWLHQAATRLLNYSHPGMPIFGEENPPTSLLLSTRDFQHIAYLDALDGSRQALSLPGGWSITLLLQKYCGGRDKRDLPKCRVALLAVIDAEGASATWTPAASSVYLKLAGASADGEMVSDQVVAGQLVSDHLLISDGAGFGVTGELTVLVGGYKPNSWAEFVRLREAMPGCPVFNTAGAPVTRKVLQNSDLVVAQLENSTLWDGVGAGLIAAAGGFVIVKGEAEPLPKEHVVEWFDAFGYQSNPTDPGRLQERRCIPAFVAGMDSSNVVRVAQALALNNHPQP